jgi:hypothetical protein
MPQSALLLALFILILDFPAFAAAQRLMPVTLSVPGPNNIAYLPIDLIPRTGSNPAAGNLAVESMILDRWAGRKD